MGLSINTATPFLLHFAAPQRPLFIGTQGQYSSSPKQRAQRHSFSQISPGFTLWYRHPDIRTDGPATSRSAPAHLPVRTRPTSGRAAMPLLCPFALSSPRSCTTPQYLLVRAFAPPSTLVCVVRQPMFQAQRSRMQKNRWVFVHNPGSIGAGE
jgi:hypothetical protein